jgi:2-hydroxychromene-2-carboxylate isomerase
VSEAAAREIELFFDVASAYSYLASTQVDALGERLGVPIRWRPMLLGGVVKATGNRVPLEVPAKARYMLMDLQDWVAWYGIRLRFPTHFPPNTLTAMRVLSAVAPEDVPRLAQALFTAYWCDNQNISDAAVLAQVIAASGFPADALVARAQEQDVKDALRRTTDEAIARGAFGAPTFFFAGRMFWGNDRLPLLERFVSATLRAGAA